MQTEPTENTTETGKNDNQSRGGIARDLKLTSERKREIASTAAKARWLAVKQLQDPNRIPQAVREGVWRLGTVDIDCYVLDNGKRLFHKRGMARALGMKSGGGNAFMKAMQRKGIGSVLTTELLEKINTPIVFKPVVQDLGHGYEATFLIDICNALIDAGRAGVLTKTQLYLAIQAEMIVRASAKVGIIAIIDEATGFIADKRKEEYRELFKEFLRETAREYKAEFPPQFFDMLYRLYNLQRRPNTKTHPQFFGGFIRKYVFQPLADSKGAILEALDERNPVVYVKGGRKYKMHSFLSDEIGLAALRAHLWQIVGIGSAVQTKIQFERGFRNAFPSTRGQMEFTMPIDLDLK